MDGRLLLGVLVVAACHFEPSPLASMPGDGPPGGSADALAHDASADADAHAADAPGSGSGSGVCGGTVWFADFSSDPTQLDVNGDGTKDWALRTGSAFDPSQLTGSGTWLEPGAGAPLDTQPKQTFATRTVIDVRMRSIGVSTGSASASPGARFWINFGYDGTGFIPVHIDIDRDATAHQTLYVWTKNGSGDDVELAASAQQGSDFIDCTLDVDPVALTAAFSGAGLAQTWPVARIVGGQTDEWATVVATATSAEFDSVRVEVCP